MSAQLTTVDLPGQGSTRQLALIIDFFPGAAPPENGYKSQQVSEALSG